MSRYKFELLVFKLAMRPSMKEDRFEKSKESHAAGVCDLESNQPKPNWVSSKNKISKREKNTSAVLQNQE